MNLSLLDFFPLSNLKLYLILVFVMFFYCSKGIKVIWFIENVHTQITFSSQICLKTFSMFYNNGIYYLTS